MKKIARTISLIWLCLATLGCDSSHAKKDEIKSEAVITKTPLTIHAVIKRGVVRGCLACQKTGAKKVQ
jgi:hypothetical protein